MPFRGDPAGVRSIIKVHLKSAVMLEEIRVRLLVPDFLAFGFVQPGQTLLNSTPQLLARDRRAVAEIGPDDLRMDAAA